MIGIGEQFPSFSVTGVKPGFHAHQENGESAFEEITENSFPGSQGNFVNQIVFLHFKFRMFGQSHPEK